MSHEFKPAKSSLSGMLGRSALSDDELASLRQKAWQRQELLIVNPSDPRLSVCEATMVKRIALKLYGEDLT